MRVTTNIPIHSSSEVETLLRRGSTPHRTALEDYVAYQWESPGDLLGGRQESKRNAVALAWLSDAVLKARAPVAALDVGCSYGNHLFMLNAMLGKPRDVRMVGVDLFDGAVRHANAFAKIIPGFSNCGFEVADLAAGLPFESETFDAVNFCDVLEHMSDPAAALAELWRVAKPNATIVVSTPLKDSLFKRIAVFSNRISGGRLYGAYYNGKDTEIDANGQPMMKTAAGHDHVSEMTLNELKRHCSEAGFEVEEIELMPVMSGSSWFDRHLLLLAGILVLEALHDQLRRPSWAHSLMLRLRKKG